MFQLVDSHIHLDDARFDPDREAVIASARAAGIAMQVVPAVDRASWDKVESICAHSNSLFPAYGLHPMFLSHHQPSHLQELEAWLHAHRSVAIGEIGLDLYIAGLDRDLQQRYFESQLLLARQFDLPVIVHARHAFDEVTLALRRMGGLRGVVHSFSGSEEQAKQLWKLGFHIGIGGPVTYQRAQRLQRIVAHMPLEFLLLESDAPDQPGSAHRGQRNEPAFVVDVLNCIAKLRDMDPNELAAITTANASSLFNLDEAISPIE